MGNPYIRVVVETLLAVLGVIAYFLLQNTILSNINNSYSALFLILLSILTIFSFIGAMIDLANGRTPSLGSIWGSKTKQLDSPKIRTIRATLLSLVSSFMVFYIFLEQHIPRERTIDLLIFVGLLLVGIVDLFRAIRDQRKQKLSEATPGSIY